MGTLKNLAKTLSGEGGLKNTLLTGLLFGGVCALTVKKGFFSSFFSLVPKFSAFERYKRREIDGLTLRIETARVLV